MVFRVLLRVWHEAVYAILLTGTRRMEIFAIAQAGMTVFFSSHALSDVEEVCDRVLILHKGELVTIKKVSELRDSFLAKTEEKVKVLLDHEVEEPIVQALREINGVKEVRSEGTRLTIIAAAGSRIAPEVNFLLASKGARVLELNTETPPLEKLYRIRR